MTGEVAFGLLVWLMEALALRNSMQFSEQEGKVGVKNCQNSLENAFLGAGLTCVPCVVA